MIRYDYYRDATIALEAFKAGQYDVRRENSSKDWATGYDSPALRDGLIKKEEIPEQIAERRCRDLATICGGRCSRTRGCAQALAYAFDFEWSNKNLFYGAYKRTRSYFDNSELAATGVPQGRRAENARAVSRADPGRGVHQGIRPAEIRRLGQYPRRAAQGARSC